MTLEFSRWAMRLMAVLQPTNQNPCRLMRPKSGCSVSRVVRHHKGEREEQHGAADLTMCNRHAGRGVAAEENIHSLTVMRPLCRVHLGPAISTQLREDFRVGYEGLAACDVYEGSIPINEQFNAGPVVTRSTHAVPA